MPRRGNTIDQANNDGYSRLDDGDLTSFWKTNPYLDEHFTGESNSVHPQWAIVDLGRSTLLDTARLWWGTPYATSYHFDYWDGRSNDVGDNDTGEWLAFPMGQVINGQGGSVTLRLASRPVKTRFVRLWLTASSGMAPTGSHDIRDRLGYAIRELALGHLQKDGRFVDCIKHAASNVRQSVIYTSSCDSWHRARDLDANTEQPGFDLLNRSGLSRGLPWLFPVGALYDTPENASAAITYLRSRGVSLRGIELGEEADGQMMDAADYGALYTQFARALQIVAPGTPLGGPSFQSPDVDHIEWPEPPSSTSWLGRVLSCLKAHGARDQFNFCSFEWYPFDDIKRSPARCLHEAPSLLDATMQRLRVAGLPADFPLFMTEYGYSAFGAQVEVDLPGMLFNADAACHFLQQGGTATYLYGYEPGMLLNEVGAKGKNSSYAWGNNMFFLGDTDWRIRYALPTYYGARLMTSKWAQPRGGIHQMFSTTVTSHKKDNTEAVRAYALLRPDKSWALLLLNEHPSRQQRIQLRFAPARAFARVDEYQYSPHQYQWHSNGAAGFPARDAPPVHSFFGHAQQTFVLPPYSLTVVRLHPVFQTSPKINRTLS